MTATGKEGADPNVLPSSALRKRGTPGSSSPSKRLQKRRMSMRNRRVSFAPDPELTMVHTFEKDDYEQGSQSPPQAFPIVAHEPEPQPAPVQQQQPPASPAVVDMEITQNLPAVQEEDDAAWNAFLAAGPVGDITAAVPSLGALAEADELEDLGGAQPEDPVQFIPNDYDNVTAAVPNLGALLEEDEEAEVAAAEEAADDIDMELTMPVNNKTFSTVVEPAPPAEELAPVPEEAEFVPEDQEDAAAAVVVEEEQQQEIAPTQEQQIQHEDEEDGSMPRSTPSSDGARHSGLANKWGFVPGDDDTMELDLEGHGRMIMGDRTYAGMYGDGVTGTTLLGQPVMVDDTVDSLHGGGRVEAAVEEETSPAAAGNAVEQQENGDAMAGDGAEEGNQDGGVPNWTMPAFLPPYLAGGAAAGETHPNSDHPALHQSPAFTNSSLNTMSTRRVSVDARRVSVTSRRMSVATLGGGGGAGGDTAGLLGTTAGSPAGEDGRTGRLSDVTEDLLADDDDDNEVQGNAAGGNGDLLAGLQQQVRLLSKGSPGAAPMPMSEQHQEHGGGVTNHTDGLLHASPATGALMVNGGTTKTPFSVGYTDSSYNPTAALLRTGGTTDLLNDNGEENPTEGPRGDIELTRGTHVTHGTTRLLRMDATASSAIAAGAKALLNDDDMTAPVMSPYQQAHHKMSHSPPASALSNGSMGRQQHLHSVRSTRSGSILNPAAHVTPGTLHRLARTPGSTIKSGAVHPSAQHGPYAAPPGSAIAARYPGSAIAQGRLSQGFTPSLAPSITFQDFAKIVEVQFLDNLRRGSSINYADLAPNPVPHTLQDAYSLLCITSPNLAELETAVHTLRSEASRLRASASELEVMLGSSNPPIFRHVQTASMEQLEAFRANVGLLKKVCRAKAVVLLKDVRCQMEDSKASRLARAADGLRQDLKYVEDQARHTTGVAAAAEKFAHEAREQLAVEAEARAAENERRKRVGAARAALEEARNANADRRRRLQEVANRVAELRREREALAAERVQMHTAAEEARAALAKLSALVVAGGMEPRAVLAQLQAVAKLESCLGVSVEQTSGSLTGGAGLTLSLRVGPIFRLRIVATPAGVRGTVEVITDSNIRDRNGGNRGSMIAAGAAQRSLAAAVAGFSPTGGEAFFVDPSAAPAAVQTAVSRLQRCSDLATELRGVRGACRHLCEVSAAAEGTAAGGVRLLFSGLHADVRFAVTLTPGPDYPLGVLGTKTKIYFDGEGQVTCEEVAAAVARVPAGPGRIRAVCAELSEMVESMAPKAKGVNDSFRSAFGNPLFGSSAAAVEPVA